MEIISYREKLTPIMSLLATHPELEDNPEYVCILQRINTTIENYRKTLTCQTGCEGDQTERGIEIYRHVNEVAERMRIRFEDSLRAGERFVEKIK